MGNRDGALQPGPSLAGRELLNRATTRDKAGVFLGWLGRAGGQEPLGQEATGQQRKGLSAEQMETGSGLLQENGVSGLKAPGPWGSERLCRQVGQGATRERSQRKQMGQ